MKLLNDIGMSRACKHILYIIMSTEDLQPKNGIDEILVIFFKNSSKGKYLIM